MVKWQAKSLVIRPLQDQHCHVQNPMMFKQFKHIHPSLRPVQTDTSLFSTLCLSLFGTTLPCLLLPVNILWAQNHQTLHRHHKRPKKMHQTCAGTKKQKQPTCLATIQEWIHNSSRKSCLFYFSWCIKWFDLLFLVPVNVLCLLAWSWWKKCALPRFQTLQVHKISVLTVLYDLF